MEKRRSYIGIPVAMLLFAALLSGNLWVSNCSARTNNDTTVIEHTQLVYFVTGKRIHMQASISDPSGIAEARLYFGTSKEARKLVFSTMKPHDGDDYVGIIPSPSPETKKIFYCLLAVNNDGNVTKTGLFELHASEDTGIAPTWQRDLDEHGNKKTLILGREDTESITETLTTTGLAGFTGSIIVNTVNPDKSYLVARNAQSVPGLSTIDGGDVEPSEEVGEVKGEGLSRNQKIGIAAGVAVAVAAGAGIAAGGGGGGGGGGGENCTDGVDNDGDELVDCDDPDCERFDEDGDGYYLCSDDCNDKKPAINPGATELCNDDIDNNCDTLVDCADPECTDPSCTEICDDDIDNDEDGLTDCEDPDCFGPACTEVCGDGEDNDGDGLVDCADADCADPSCPEICRDGIDNDSDGKTDCADPDCFGPACTEVCDDGEDNDTDGMTDCDDSDCYGPGCPEVCGDGEDNDGDGNTDCDDSDCFGPFCAEVCDDGLDNDGDGDTDCNDSDCSTDPNCVITIPKRQEFSKTGAIGEIVFDPNVGVEGDPVGVDICFNSVGDLGSGDQIKVTIDGETKGYSVCDTSQCQLYCDLGDIFMFSSTTTKVKFVVRLETGNVTLINKNLPLAFK